MPDNPFRQALDERAAENPFRAKLEEPSAGFVARDRAARTVLNNLMAVPDASGELLADAMNYGRAVLERSVIGGARNAKRLVGAELDPTPPTIGDLASRNAGRESGVQMALRAIPRGTIEQADAALAAVPALMPGGESPGEAYDRNLAETQAAQDAMRAAHPVAATAGDVGGDILSLFLGRRSTGADKLLRRVETRLAGRTTEQAAQTAAGDLAKALTPGMRSLARGGARSVEAGVEAAVLDILKDPNADPLETAAIAAGSQLVGSGFIGGAKGLLSGGPTNAGLKITVAAASTMGLLQILKSATPGGENRILESIESGYGKVALALGLGAGAAAIGATRYGRGNTALSDQTRALLDNMSLVNRGTTLSLLTDWTEGDADDRATIERVLTAVAQDPTYRGKNAAERRIVSRLLNRYRTGGQF